MARRAAQGGVSPEPESRHTPPESFPAERTKETDRYGLVLVLTLLALLTSAITSLGTWSQLLALVPQAAALLLALYTSGTSRRLLRLTVFAFLGLTALLSIAIAVTASAQVIRTGYAAIMGGLVFTALLAIGRRLARQQRVTMQTVFGALCIYLFVGTLFAVTYGALAAVGAQPFFVQQPNPTGVDFLYFSFVTMTTVGYGDFTAAQDLGRMLAVTQALIGQIYLVTVVAILVGNIGRERREIRRR